jgi:hypothetical protein
MKQAERMRVFKSMSVTSKGCDGRYPAFDILHIEDILPCGRAVDDGGIHQARKELLGLVSFTHYCASTPSLSTSWSTTVRRLLISREASRLDAFSGYPVHT